MNGGGIVAVLAGGRGSRMGRPKALVELGGRPLIRYALDAAAEAGLEAVVVAKPDTELPELPARVIREPATPSHPLLGAVAALGQSPVVVLLPCDMPFVGGPLLGWLAAQPDPIAVCEGGGRMHPLLGRFTAKVAPGLRAAIEAGTSAQDAVTGLGARLISEQELSNFGPPMRVLFNVNDPSDLAEAERMVGA